MIYILLPAYNEERNLIKIFKKIEKLPDARTNISVVLVDDFSTDNTSQLLKKKYKFKLSYIRHNHLPPPERKPATQDRQQD